MLTKEKAIDLLKNHPLKYAKLLGFDRLIALNEEWLKDMIPHAGAEDTSLQAHRLSYKTTCVSITLARIIILLPNKRTLFLRKTDSDVKEIINQVKKILLSTKTQCLVEAIYGVPLMLNVLNANELSTNLTTDVRGSNQLVGMGIGSSLTGKHFDYIFTDDISNINDRISKAERDKTKLVYMELQNIKNRGGRIYNTLTPWHVDDVASIMPPAKKYTCYETGLITDEELEHIKKSMSPSLFAANYELRHIASDDVIFTNPEMGADPSMVEQGIAQIDAAYHGEDYTAYSLVCIHDGKYYVFGKIWRKHIDDVLDEILTIHHGFKAGKIYCEENGDKGYLGRDLRKRGERVVIYSESMNKYVKITSYLKFEWENVIFVKGTDPEYINQICDFNDNAEHDDAPDSLASLIRAIPNKPKREQEALNLFGR